MSQPHWWVVLLISVMTAAPSFAVPRMLMISTPHQVRELNKTLSGQVYDYTANHWADRRIHSAALCSKRSLYVYVPCGYDGQTPLPAMIWMHGFGEDEMNFLKIVPHFDRMMRCGKMPRMIIACPDGSVTGRPALTNAGSWYLNSKAGRFEDWVIQDVWGFLQQNFAIHPDRNAHILAGGSMGGFAAYNLAFKHRETFGTIVGVLPALSLRYEDCHGRHFAPYDPNCVRFREHSQPFMVIGRFYGVVLIPEMFITKPLVGNPYHAIGLMTRENPIEMLETYAIKPGEFHMFVGYGGKDQLNLNAQAQHFLDDAASRGLAVTSNCIPDGDHSTKTGIQLLPSVAEFLLKHVGASTPAPKEVQPEVKVTISEAPTPAPVVSLVPAPVVPLR